MGKLFSWERFWDAVPKILSYLPVTISIVAVATVFGVILGFLVAIVRIKKTPVIFQICTVYISFMRGTPLLVQLFLILYGLPELLNPILGINIGREWDTIYFAYLTFILNQGAFLSSIFYTALESVPAGQLEAGYSVGLTEFQGYFRIVIPQAVRTAMPPFASDFIGLFQNVSLVFTIGIIDIMGRAKTIGTVTGHSLEVYMIVGIIYVVINFLLRILFAVIDRLLSYGKER